MTVTLAYSKAVRDDWTILFADGALGTTSDADLLATFAAARGDASAEAAFATLVDRHGPLVLGTCRHVTRDPHAADDAFQAVFLVLARKAGTVRLETGDSLGRWLYGVSLRVARQARAAAAVRQRHFPENLDGLDPVDSRSSFDPCERADLRAAIDAEIARLPARYRSAVVLCHLEGLPQEQAARRLRCPIGTVQSRLHRARERLRTGLARRGLAPAAGAARRVARVDVAGGRPAQPGQKVDGGGGTIDRGRGGRGHSTRGGCVFAGLTLRQMVMRQTWMIAGYIALGLATTGAAVRLTLARDDKPKTAPLRKIPNPWPKQRPPPRTSLPIPRSREQLDRLKAEYENADREFYSFYRGSYIPKENLEKALQVRPDLPAFVRRIADLAAASPKDPAVRDAMLWVIQQGQPCRRRTVRGRVRHCGQLAPPQPRR